MNQQTMNDRSATPIWRDLLILVLAVGLLYTGFSWLRPLASPDEPRYSEIPREMIASGDWVSPRLNGVLYFYKPPLFYWAQAVSQSIGGHNRFMLRLWPAVFGILGVIAVYLTARFFYDRRTAIHAAVILATSLLYFALSQLIILDMMLAVLISGSLFCFIIGLTKPPGSARRNIFWIFYALIALAVMTKGLMAILVPGAIIFLWLLLLNQWRELKNLHLIVGSLIFLVIVLPWHLSIHQHHDTWFDFYIIHEHFARYLHDVSNRSQPFWFFFVILPLGLFPWLGVLPQAIRQNFRHGWKARREHREVWFFLIWAVFILLFFSISKSKLIPYILPAYPPLAMLLGRYWTTVEPASEPRFGLRFIGTFLIIGGIAVPIAGFIQGCDGRLTGDGTLLFAIVAVTFVAVGIWWLLLSRKQQKGDVFWKIAAGFIVIAALFNPLTAMFQPPSPERLMTTLRKDLKPDDFVCVYKDYFHAVPLYLDRTIGLIATKPTEQKFGLEWEDHTDRYMKMSPLRKRWKSKTERIYLIMYHHNSERFRDRIRNPFFEYAQDKHFIIYTNLPVTSPPQPH